MNAGWRVRGAAIVASLLVAVSASPLLADEAMTIAPSSHHYYYFFDQPVPLTLDVTRVAVQTVERGDEEAARAAFKSANLSLDQVEAMAVDTWWMAVMPASSCNADAVEATVRMLGGRSDLAGASPVFLDAQGNPLLITRDILMRFRDGVSAEEAEQLLASLAIGTIVQRDFGGMRGAYRIRCNASDGLSVLETANKLALMPEVRYAEPNKIITGTVSLVPNDPYWSSLWGLNQGNNYDMDAPQAWDVSTGSSSILVAVLDLGTQLNHPDLQANLVYGYDATGNGTGGGPLNSCDNHGTEVAGCVSAVINNSLGVVGIAPGCRVVPIKIGVAVIPCSTQFQGEDAWLVDGLNWAQGHSVRVSSSSFSWGISSTVANKYDEAFLGGMVHMAASGNEGSSSIGFPASWESVYAVGAITSSGNRASFSNYGALLDFVAPGVNIWTTDRTGAAGDSSGDYVQADGTSFASPYAAGVAALVLSRNSGLSPTDVGNIISATCLNLGAAGWDQYYGWGLVKARAAMDMATAVPGAFNLLTPADGATAVSINPTFTWSASSGATSYTLSVDTVSTFDSLNLIVRSGLTGTSHNLTGSLLQKDTQYYWKVAAVNVAGQRASTPAYRGFHTLRDCNNNGVDDFQEIAGNPSLDCDSNGWLDSCELSPSFSAGSPTYTPLGYGYPQAFTLTSPLDAVSAVSLTFVAYGDLNFASEYVDISINSTFVGTAFYSGVYFDCEPNQVATLSVPAATFNAAKAGGDAVINMVPSESVDPTFCGSQPTAIQVSVSYTRSLASVDCNTNGVLDVCELPGHDCNSNGVLDSCDIASGTSLDLNHNGIPDECEVPTGACCYPDGTCAVTTQAACSGTWQGGGTTCSPNPCVPVGACCIQGACTVTTQAACSGTWMGAGTTCSPNPCPPVGACCIQGACTVTTQAACSGTWMGAGTTCSPNPCPPVGACCIQGACTVTTQAACSGTWMGAGTTCSPNPCPPVGACCISGACTITTQAACSGTWMGAGTTCSPNPCAPPVCRGDCNCDGAVGFLDIDLFVAAIPNNQANWAARYLAQYGTPPPEWCWENTDVNGVGTHAGFDDIDPFVAKIPSGCP